MRQVEILVDKGKHTDQSFQWLMIIKNIIRFGCGLPSGKQENWIMVRILGFWRFFSTVTVNIKWLNMEIFEWSKLIDWAQCCHTLSIFLGRNFLENLMICKNAIQKLIFIIFHDYVDNLRYKINGQIQVSTNSKGKYLSHHSTSLHNGSNSKD